MGKVGRKMGIVSTGIKNPFYPFFSYYLSSTISPISPLFPLPICSANTVGPLVALFVNMSRLCNLPARLNSALLCREGRGRCHPSQRSRADAGIPRLGGIHNCTEAASNPPFSHFHPFLPIFPHFSRFSPISPIFPFFHFSAFCLANTLGDAFWVR